MKNNPKNMSICQIELAHIGRGLSRVLRDTIAIFRDACKFISNVVEEHWDDIDNIEGNKLKLTFVESLIHETKLNKPVYPDFDKLFYKFPAYYRRSAINYCLGQVSSYHTRLGQYNVRRKNAIDQGRRFREKAPVLSLNPSAFPSMYKDQMYTLVNNTIRIKVFVRNTWDWIEVSTPNRDLKDLEEKSSIGTIKSPDLVYKFHKFYLVFPIKYSSADFKEIPVSKRTILSVDLGVNRGATVSIMDSTGTIQGRYFDPFTSERDRMDHIINKIRKIQKESGTGNSLSSIYTKLQGIKDNYVHQLSRWIANLAIQYHVYGVVLEHLGNIKGSKSARIHHWCKCRIREFVQGMCFREGIRVFTINPRNTSALAYDGSGKVVRGYYKSANGKTKYNYSVCTFPSGKQYNCDLNGSYNIGTRYFLREFQKSMDETKWSQLMAEVPELAKRTDCTLSTLWKLNEALAS